MADLTGKSVLHYHVLQKIGQGGMGIVYKAEDSKLGRKVALKMLPPHLLTSKDDKARFQREAKAAAALNHPHIATVYEINEHENVPFIVMEYVEGRTLNHHIDRGPFKLEDAINIAIQVAEGLKAAHAKHIVHRDIKSSNIILDPEMKAKILDFGLAKTSMSTKLTQMGSTVGTVAYMSPEQVKGNEVNERSDLWSLGVVIYEMISGRLPFLADYEQAVIYAIQNEQPEPLTALRTGVPMSLEWIVTKLLAKNPAQRYQNAQDLIIDLKAVDLTASGMSRISDVKSVSHTTPQKINTKLTGYLPWLISVISLLLMITMAAFWFLSPNTEPDLQPVYFNTKIPLNELVNISVYSSITISPDGSKIIFRSSNQLFLRSLDNLTIAPIPGTANAGSPFFSPDGKWIGFYSDGKLKKLALGGSSPIVLADASDNRGATWGKNGLIVYSPITTAGLMMIKDVGGPVEQLTQLDSSRNERTHRWPSFLPDGKTVLFTVGLQDSPDYYEDARIDAVNIETGERKTIINNASSAKYLPDGYLVYSTKGILFVVRFDPDNLQVLSTPVSFVDDLNGDATSGAMHYAISENGTLTYIPGRSEGDLRSLVKISIDGTVSKLDVQQQAYAEPRLSPDGKKIALTIGSGKDFDIWIYDVEKNNLTRLTFGGTNRTPAWSPDGKQIIYFNNDKGVRSLRVKRSDGSGEESIVTDQLRTRAYIDNWSADGKYLLIDTFDPRNQSGLSFLNLDGRTELQLYINTEADEYMGALSPDVKWIAYISNENGPYEVFVQPFPNKGGKWQISLNGGAEPKWSKDGKKLFYISGSSMMMVPISTEEGSIKTGKAVVLFNNYSSLPVDSGITYDVSHDGQYIYTTIPPNSASFQQINVIVNWLTKIKKVMASS